MGKLRQKVREIDGGRLVPALLRKNARMAFSLFHESVELRLKQIVSNATQIETIRSGNL
jgi:hypothetical protein